MDRAVRVAVQAASLVNELRAEMSNPQRANELVWRFRTAYQPQLATLWQDASLIPGIDEQNFLPASVEVIRVEGLGSDSRRVYTMTELNEDNAATLVRYVIDRLRWLAQYSLVFQG